MAAHHRRGSGSVIVVVVLLLFIIATVTMGRSFFTSYVSDKTTKSVYGDIAYQISDNILKEGHLKFGSLSNSSSTAVYEAWRSETPLFTEEIELSVLPASTEMFKSFQGYDLPYDGVEVKVLSRHPASNVIPFLHDSFGLLELKAAVRHRATGTMRTKSSLYEYRTTLTGPPVPLSQYTVLIGDGVFLQNAYGINNDANETINEAMSRIDELFTQLEDFITQGNKIKDELEDKADSANPLVSGKYEDAAREVEKAIAVVNATISQKPAISLLSAGENTKTNPQAVSHFFEPPVCYYSREPLVKLSELNLPDRVKTRLGKIENAEGSLAQAAKALKQYLDSRPTSLGGLKQRVQKLCDETVKTAQVYEALLLEDYKGFQEKLVAVAGSEYSLFLSAFKQLSKEDVIRKATAIITSEDDGTGRSINQKFNDFLRKHKRFSGLLFVANGTQELEINHEFNGRAVIACEKDVLIKKAEKASESKDLTTIISFGQMSLLGPAEACLIPWHTFKSVPGITLKGSLIFSRLSFVGGTAEEVLGAEVTYDEELSSASGSDAQLFKKHQYVTISPAILASGVDRR